MSRLSCVMIVTVRHKTKGNMNKKRREEKKYLKKTCIKQQIEANDLRIRNNMHLFRKMGPDKEQFVMCELCNSYTRLVCAYNS